MNSNTITIGSNVTLNVLAGKRQTVERIEEKRERQTQFGHESTPMHFSIPHTQELSDENGSQYTAFNLHVNGVLHCVVRYSQLYDLNEQLKQEFGAGSLPTFPPKKIFSVKGDDLDDRRLQLEKYVQGLCQHQKLSSSETLATFLSRAQQETRQEESVPASFEVSLMNGSKLKVDIKSTDKTDVILENVVASLGMDVDLTYFFGLYLLKSEPDGKYSIVRQLQEFECPYISMKSIKDRESHKVVIRKAYWDQTFDNAVKQDSVGLNLLNVQAESEVNVEWIDSSAETKQRLANLKGKGSKQEYLQLCQTLTNYGYIQFKKCTSDFPSKNTKVTVNMGNNEIKFSVAVNKEEIREDKFSVVRIKSWKVTSHHEEKSTTSNKDTNYPILQFSFEYLVRKGNLRWIALLSEQAVMMSMAVKSMVDELLQKRRGEKIKKPSDRKNDGPVRTYKPRDKKAEALFLSSEVPIGDADAAGNMQKAKESVKKLSDKLSSVSILSKPTNSTPNESDPMSELAAAKKAFEGIGDEDL